ncbi:MAG: PA0069 family radical SAM protein [Cyclobacteriaceae bacterium]
MSKESYKKGRGSQIRTYNKFESSYFDNSSLDGIDNYDEGRPSTQVFKESPKSIISKNDSPDIAWNHSINPYQGCEHGCTYCYARNSHEYWGFNAGIDFESKIIVKENASELLEKQFLKKTWKPAVVMLSGNTDCYQPLERKYEITRSLLKLFLKYQNPVGIITKNALIQRDMDLISELAKKNLIHVAISINSLNEELRRILEPRTSSAKKRLETIKVLSDHRVPVLSMIAPIIPGLNHHEIPKVVKTAAEAGATKASYVTVRLNGQIGEIFKDWLDKTYPLRADKVWNQISEFHDGKVNDTEYGRRMRGAGVLADTIKKLFEVSVKKHMKDKPWPALDYGIFRRGGNYSLFG